MNRIEELKRNIDVNFVEFPKKFPHDRQSARYECRQIWLRKELKRLEEDECEN